VQLRWTAVVLIGFFIAVTLWLTHAHAGVGGCVARIRCVGALDLLRERESGELFP
jgi:hypothetical protein